MSTKLTAVGRPTDGEGDMPPLVLRITTGTATMADVAELLEAISDLYEMAGGSGITFKVVKHQPEPSP